MTTPAQPIPVRSLDAAYVTPGAAFLKPLNIPVYHYTDRDGFLGILSKREFWATDVMYLNDAAEVDYGRDRVREALERRFNGPYGTRLSEIAHLLTLIPMSANLCIVSFSAIRDDLSQWRAYSHGGGFSIGIPSRTILELRQSSAGTLYPVCYSPDQQATEADKLVRELEDRLSAVSDQDWQNATFRINAGMTFAAASTALAVRMKHPAFKDENEWRMEYFTKPADVRCRSRRTMLTPYRVVAIPSGTSFFDEVDVLVGPTAHGELAKRTARQMLAQISTTDTFTRVNSSSVPYRDW